MTSTPTFRMLAVCTGNVCRSPAVERLLAVELRRRTGPVSPTASGSSVAITSAGTRALVGAPMSPETAALVTELGGDPSGFRSRQLTPEMIDAADVVLALTRRHRAQVVELRPAAVRRTFTLRELARLLPLVETSGTGLCATAGDVLATLVPRAATARRNPAVADDDVIDPFGRGMAVYRTSFDQLYPAVRAIASVAAAGPDAPSEA